MRGSVLAVAAVGLLALGAGCGDDPTPSPATCELSVDTLRFDSLLPPLFSGDPQTSVRQVTVTNAIETVSADGNADLAGTLVVRVESRTGAPPVIRVKGSDPSFRIPPRESVTWGIEAVVERDTDPGFYLGVLDFGTGCTQVPFQLLVEERIEDPPTLVAVWGRRGSGAGEFETPSGVAAAGNGSVYVLDVGNGNVQRFDPDGTPRGRWSEWQEADRDSLPTHFLAPGGIAVDAGDFVWVSDREPEHSRDRITRFGPGGAYVDRYGPTQGGSDIHKPFHLGLDAEGRVYFIELERKRVSVAWRSEEFWVHVRHWDLSRWSRMVPWGLAVSPLGFVYVSDWFNNRVLKFTTEGEFLLEWGSRGTGLGQFNGPAGLAVDPEGNVYVVDSGNHRVQKFNPNGAPFTEWGGRGTGASRFSEPTAVSVSPQGLIVVADTGNRRIQVFAPGGQDPRPR